MTFRVVWTGFEPFLEYDYNPSWDVAQTAAESLDAQAHQLPVDFESASDAHRAYEGDSTPGLLVHVGVAARRDYVAFERFAHNVHGVRDDRPQTSEGRDELVPHGPLAMQTEVLLGRLVDRYVEYGSADLPRAEISRDAGTYVCNAAYYHSLRAFEGSPVNVLFIHIPMMDVERARRLGMHLARIVEPLSSG